MQSEKQPRLIDHHFAHFMAVRSGLREPQLTRFRELIQQLSLSMEDGHSCLMVEQSDTELLIQSPLVSTGKNTPLILVNNRLYLHRYFTYEQRLAQQLLSLSKGTHQYSDLPGLLDQCYGNDEKEVNLQRKAAEVALGKSLCIISGGPGTGKTTTIVRILGLLLKAEGRGLSIGIGAPTGKAAKRMEQSIAEGVQRLDFEAEILDNIPTEATTLHRMLGVRRNSVHFIHNNENPMGWDVVVVDEASMVDLALMSKLVDGLKPHSRLILLGDKDQLASVESGSVLRDCIEGLPENTVELKKSYRFEHSIKSLAEAINQGDGETAWDCLHSKKYPNVKQFQGSLRKYIGERYLAYMNMVHQMENGGPEKLFNQFNNFQVLCASNHGPKGVQGVNAMVEKFLKQQGYTIDPNGAYPGRPVMITANDYNLQLFNGDIGIFLTDPEDGVLKAWFETHDGSYKKYPPFRLPRHETVWAMTIHKSQGSEFKELLVILPDEEHRVLNKQLVYTGVTRAKENVQLAAIKKILSYAVQFDYPRSSGLSDMLMTQDW